MKKHFFFYCLFPAFATKKAKKNLFNEINACFPIKYLFYYFIFFYSHHLQDEKMREFFVALALCHTVQADEVEPQPFDSVDGANDSTGPVTTFTYQVGYT